MTLKVTITVEPNQAYAIEVRTFYKSEDVYGNKVDYGFSPKKVVKPGQHHEVWISSSQSIRVDEIPLEKEGEKVE